MLSGLAFGLISRCFGAWFLWGSARLGWLSSLSLSRLVCSLGLTACLAFCTTPSWMFRLEDFSGLFWLVFGVFCDLESFLSLDRFKPLNTSFATGYRFK